MSKLFLLQWGSVLHDNASGLLINGCQRQSQLLNKTHFPIQFRQSRDPEMKLLSEKSSLKRSKRCAWEINPLSLDARKKNITQGAKQKKKRWRKYFWRNIYWKRGETRGQSGKRLKIIQKKSIAYKFMYIIK